jgi:hypothetical protein
MVRFEFQLKDEILLLEKELQEKISNHTQQLRSELSKTEHYLKEEIKSLTSQ